MVTLALDHVLVWGDVDRLAARVAEAVGVPPDDGGTHPGRGTRNAIFLARGKVALEVLGRDPAQDPPAWAPDLDDALWWWAVRTDRSIEETCDVLAGHGLATSEPEVGERRRADGSRVGWTIVDVVDHGFGTTVPFVIRWGDARPPWGGQDAACELRRFRAVHPDPQALREVFAALGLDGVEVGRADGPGLEVELAGPAGTIGFATR